MSTAFTNTTTTASDTVIHRPTLPPLEQGDHLDQQTFHARYEAMPPGTRAELIEGIVHMPSPARNLHGRAQTLAIHWLATYDIATPGTKSVDNATDILGDETEPQPDGMLMILPEKGGRVVINEQDYITGPPELVVEVASSTESYDLHSKRREYERHGVQEYLVLALRQRRAFWFALRDGKFVELSAGDDGVLRSQVFPGLWLDPSAIFNDDGKRLLEVLQQGLASPDHADFVQRLAAVGGTKDV
jgi:Uma2 family endonuclease